MLVMRLEELAIKLQTARYDVRDTGRMLNECSEQLAATEKALNTTAANLKDANNKILNKICGEAKPGEMVEEKSDSETKTCSDCNFRLREAWLDEQDHKVMVKECQSHLAQAREDNRTASATARECLHQRNQLQKRLKGCELLIQDLRLQDPVAKEEQPEVRNQGCECISQSTESKKGKDATKRSVGKSSVPKERVATTDLADKQANMCVQQLKEVTANLTILETTLENCSSHLKQERADKSTVAERDEDCKRELSRSRDRLEKEGGSLIQCENQLKQTRSELSNAMKQCPDGSKSKPNAPESGLKDSNNDRPSSKSRDETAKLTRCNEELRTATDTIRWKTNQMEKCAENLVQARGKVQSLSASLLETESTQETIIFHLKSRYQKQVDDQTLYYEQKLEHAENENSLLVSIIKSIFVLFVVIVLYCLFFSVPYNLFLLLDSYSYRFRTFVGIRDRRVLYHVNFRRVRYPH